MISDTLKQPSSFLIINAIIYENISTNITYNININ